MRGVRWDIEEHRPYKANLTAMTTASLTSTQVYIKKHYPAYNKLSILSFAISLSFVVYFLAIATNLLLFHTTLRFTLVFLFVAPLAALTLSLISLRQIQETRERGATLSYVALSIAAFYFTIALSIGFVLIAFYLLYTLFL